jgi:hypothetical protein
MESTAYTQERSAVEEDDHRVNMVKWQDAKRDVSRSEPLHISRDRRVVIERRELNHIRRDRIM